MHIICLHSNHNSQTILHNIDHNNNYYHYCNKVGNGLILICERWPFLRHACCFQAKTRHTIIVCICVKIIDDYI